MCNDHALGGPCLQARVLVLMTSSQSLPVPSASSTRHRIHPYLSQARTMRACHVTPTVSFKAALHNQTDWLANSQYAMSNPFH